MAARTALELEEEARLARMKVEVVEPEPEPVVYPLHVHRLLDVPYDGEPFELEPEPKAKGSK